MGSLVSPYRCSFCCLIVAIAPPGSGSRIQPYTMTGADTFISFPGESRIMDINLRDTFLRLWNEYAPGSELPITFGISTETSAMNRAPPPRDWRCLVCDLAKIRKGISLAFTKESLSCSGAEFYLGYASERRPEFRYFLSTGKPGVVDGERYKRSPEIVDAMDRKPVRIPAEGKCYLFRRWDQLTEEDAPEVAVFFARPEVLSGLFTLANFDQSDPNGGVICPFGSGCSSIVYYPWLEQQSAHPRAVLGMFDPSARPCVPVDVLTLAIPMKKFTQMIGYMEESFFITPTWEKVKKKIHRSATIHTR